MGVFKKTSEQQIIKDADKVSAMIEDLSALSWDRITEIGKLLQNDPSVEQCDKWGRELISIAQANTSVLSKIGINAASFSGKVMPSGIEILNDSQAVTTPEVKSVTPVELTTENKSDSVLPESLTGFFNKKSADRHEFIPRGDGASDLKSEHEKIASSSEVTTGKQEAQITFESIESQVTDAKANTEMLTGGQPGYVQVQSYAANEGDKAYREVQEAGQTKNRAETTVPGLGFSHVTESVQKDGQLTSNSTIADPVSMPKTQPAFVSETKSDPTPVAQVEKTVHQALTTVTDMGYEYVIPQSSQSEVVSAEPPMVQFPASAEGKPASEVSIANSESGTPTPIFEQISAHKSIDLQSAVGEERANQAVQGNETPRTFAEAVAAQTARVESAVESNDEPTLQTTQDFSHLKQIYKSRDGNLCIYEDELGHYIAVDALKLKR